MEGYVYFITDGEYIKIGYTKNHPKKRLKQLNTGNDKKLFLLGYILGNMSKEKELHKKFGRLRVRNSSEWFNVNDELLDYINQNNEMIEMKDMLVDRNPYMNNMIMVLKKI